MQLFLEILPLVLAVLVPVGINAVKGNILSALPSKYIPALLSLGGGVLGAAAAFFEIPIGDLSTGDVGIWEAAITGILIGAASVGMHQINTQRKKA